jgi:LPXTG-motif cell wall-anchored protein
MGKLLALPAIGLLMVAGSAATSRSASAHSLHTPVKKSYFCQKHPKDKKCTAKGSGAGGVGGSGSGTIGSGGNGSGTGGKGGKGGKAGNGGNSGVGATSGNGTAPNAGVGNVQTGGGGTFYTVASSTSHASTQIKLVSKQGGHITVRTVRLPGNLPATGGGEPAGMPGVAGLMASVAILLGGWMRRRSRLAL